MKEHFASEGVWSRDELARIAAFIEKEMNKSERVVKKGGITR